MRLGIRVSDPAVLERLREHLPPGWKPAASPIVDVLYSLIVGSNGTATGQRSSVRRFNLLYVGAGRLARTLDLNEAFTTLASSLHSVVALQARRRLFVRAGVVGWRGRAIVIPGLRAKGTSSLVAALVRAGATYYSDEYAVFDARGRVHPYPKPLSLREKDGEAPKTVPVEALGGRPGNRPLPVGLIVVTAYKRGVRWRPRMLSPGQAVLALLEHTVLARVQPKFALEALQHVAAGAVTLKGRRGEAEDVVGPILQRLDTSVRELSIRRQAAGKRRGSYATEGTG